MESTGARLKKIRLEKGYSLEDVHKKTKIHYNVLKAIEEDSLVNFNPIYIKGFLKIYCAFLGANPEEYISNYKKEKAQGIAAEQRENKMMPEETPAVRSKEPGVAIRGVKKPFLTLDLVKAIRSKLKIAVSVIIVIIVAIFLFRLIGMAVSKLSLLSKRIKPVLSSQASKKENKKNDTLRPAKAQPAREVKTQVQPAVVKPSQKEPVVASTIRLSIRTREDCWIQLKVDGRTAFQNILKKGRSESWQAKEKIEFSLGNAGVVDLEVNGKLISSVGRRGQAVKNILITKDGLSVPR